MAGTQSPQEVELLARFPRGFQQDMIADIEALPEPERTFRMDNFIKNYQLQVKGWKVHPPAQPALFKPLAQRHVSGLEASSPAQSSFHCL